MTDYLFLVPIMSCIVTNTMTLWSLYCYYHIYRFLQPTQMQYSLYIARVIYVVYCSKHGDNPVSILLLFSMPCIAANAVAIIFPHIVYCSQHDGHPVSRKLLCSLCRILQQYGGNPVTILYSVVLYVVNCSRHGLSHSVYIAIIICVMYCS